MPYLTGAEYEKRGSCDSGNDRDTGGALLVGALLLFAMRYFYQTMGQKGVIIVLAGGAGLLLVFLYLIEVFRRIKNGDKGKFD